MAAQATPPPEPAPPASSGCATPVEPLEGVPGVTETPSVDGVCRVSAAVCSILGTDGDDVLTGSPFDDILCGLGGNDRLEGGDGNDVLLGGEGEDELVGGAGDDCIVGGPGADRAEWGKWVPAGTIETDDGVLEFPAYPIGPGLEDTVEIDDTITDLNTGDPIPRVKWVSPSTPKAGAPARSRASNPLWRQPSPPGAEDAQAPPANAPAGASSFGPGGLRLGLPDRRLAVRDDVVRVPVSCSAEAAAELVLLAGSQRIAHKRFTCTPPETTVRVRLNKAGRKLVATTTAPRLACWCWPAAARSPGRYSWSALAPEISLFSSSTRRQLVLGGSQRADLPQRPAQNWRLPGDLGAPPAGLEPATCGLEVRCSIQLSYRGRRAQLSGPVATARASRRTRRQRLPGLRRTMRD